MSAQGSGRNQRWVWKEEAHFVYELSGLLELNVERNTGDTVEFAIAIPSLSQNRATSNEAIALAPIDSPILSEIWRELEVNVFESVPGYHVARRLVQIAEIVDPAGRQTLTWFYRRLKQAGVDLPRDKNIELVSRVAELSGHRLKLIYVRDFGVQSIDVVEGDKVTRDELVTFAQRSSHLMDYVLGELAKQHPRKSMFETSCV
jgi:hypothetical protein